MSKVLIDRALLERVQERLDPHRDAVLWGDVCDTFRSAPSGTPAMPVKAYYHEAPNEYGGLNKSVGLEVRKEFADAPLVLESDALARIACLEGGIAKRDARIMGLESQYQRDVWGLNNEGDPIGGDPAGGYANDNARLRSELAAIKAQEPVAIEFRQFMTAVVTGAGLLSCGKQSKGLAAELSATAYKYLLGAPSPAGVDGLEVVAWVTTGFSGKSRTRRAFTVNADDAARQHTNWTPHYRQVNTDQLCRLSAAQAIIDGLQEKIERLQFSLEVAKTDELSAAVYAETESIKHSLWDAEKERDQQARRIGELEGLLRHAQKQVPTGSGLHMRIDAAISAGKEWE